MSHKREEDKDTNGGARNNNNNNGLDSSTNGTANYNFHVELSQENFIRFPPTLGKPFFDECNLELVVINTGEFYRYPLPGGSNKSGDDKPKKYMAICEFTPSEVTSAKFSLDHKWFSLQQSPSCVEFFSVESAFRFSQVSKRPKDQILGHYWTFASENLFYVTQQGVELYQTIPKSKSLKLLKDFRQQIYWYIYSHKNRVLLAYVGGTGLQGYYFRLNTLNKIPKFDVDVVSKTEPLNQRDITIAQLYSKLYCIHNNTKKLEMVIYKLSRDSVVPVMRINLFFPGANYVHVVDDLLVVHTIDSKIAMIYDIRAKDDVQYPVAAPLPLAPLKSAPNDAVDFYSKDWVFHSPNYILDVSNGYVWEAIVNLEAISISFSEKTKLIDFLMRRSNSKALILKVMKGLLEDTERLAVISAIFDQLNVVLASAPESGEKKIAKPDVPPPAPPTSISTSMLAFDLFSTLGFTQPADSVRPDDFTVSSGNNSSSTSPFAASSSLSATSVQSSISSPALSVPAALATPTLQTEDFANRPARKNAEGYQVIDQVDMYLSVFAPLDEQGTLDFKYLVAVLTEYIRSLYSHLIQIKHFLYELIISVLVRNNRFYQLHQFLQYHVVSDSVPVASKLLSLESVYPPAYQLALDMLKRSFSPGDILEVLLSRNQVLAALRVLRANRELPKIPASRFLDAALTAGDSTQFYTVYKFFEQRKELGPDCKKFIDAFNKMFYEEFLQTPPTPSLN